MARSHFPFFSVTQFLSVLGFGLVLVTDQVEAGPLPKDLVDLQAAFSTIVKADPEMDLLMAPIRISADRETSSTMKKFLDRETKTWFGKADLYLSEVSVKKTEYKQYEVLSRDLFRLSPLPYFCTSLPKPDGQEYSTPEFCKKQLQKLLAGLQGRDLAVYFLELRGESWGNFERVIVMIQSAEDKTHALRYEFDIVHEI